MSAGAAPQATPFGQRIAAQAVSLAIGFAVATLVFGTNVRGGFVLTFITIAVAVRFGITLNAHRRQTQISGEAHVR